jgi:hypothetical protein
MSSERVALLEQWKDAVEHQAFAKCSNKTFHGKMQIGDDMITFTARKWTCKEWWQNRLRSVGEHEQGQRV